MARIAYFVHGRGKGHAVRTRAVLEQLPPQTRLRLFCAGRAHDVLGDHPAAEKVITCRPGRGMALSFARRLRTDRQRLREWRPSLVVSDGDGPSVHAAWSLGYPVLAVGHGLIFAHTHLNGAVPKLRRLREALNAGTSSWPAARRIAVHFAPVEPTTRGTVVARPDLWSPSETSRRRDNFVLAYFRDDDGSEALERLAARGHRVLCFGRLARTRSGIEVHRPDLEAFRHALTSCRAVVGSAGNHLPAECAMLGVPMLALHRSDDWEHTLNARLIESAGIGVGAALDALDTRLIRRFEAALDEDRTALARRTLAMHPVSEAVPKAIADLCRPTRGELPPPDLVWLPKGGYRRSRRAPPYTL